MMVNGCFGYAAAFLGKADSEDQHNILTIVHVLFTSFSSRPWRGLGRAPDASDSQLQHRARDTPAPAIPTKPRVLEPRNKCAG